MHAAYQNYVFEFTPISPGWGDMGVNSERYGSLKVKNVVCSYTCVNLFLHCIYASFRFLLSLCFCCRDGGLRWCPLVC